MDEQVLRELRLGLYCLRGNAFWLWLRGQMEQRLDYLNQRLRQVADWQEYCRLSGQLDALDQLRRQIDEIAASAKEGEEDGFHTATSGL